MKLKIVDRDAFVSEFIQPLSRITDSGIVKIDANGMNCLVSTADDTIIVYGQYTQKFDIEPTVLNIPDLKKLVKLINLIDTPLELDINSNNIEYTSPQVRFKYHLFEDGIISSPALNMSKLSRIDFNASFSLTQSKLSSLIKGSTLNPDISKMYLSFAEKNVTAELTDKARQNVDSYSLIISDDYTGPANASVVPINFEIARLLNSSKLPTFKVKYATSLNVFNFELQSQSTNLNYIISALTN